MTGFEFRFCDSLPSDPFSEDYAASQLARYEVIAGKSYSVDNETGAFTAALEFQDLKSRPYPYITEDPEAVANQLTGIAHIIRSMRLPAGSRILELGAGWGNTSITLARMGYQVTAIDIEPLHVDILRHRAQNEGAEGRLTAHRAQFLESAQFGSDYDAVLFFESFHHCADHRQLIEIVSSLIKPSGIIVFAAEPIDPNFPLPWGLRLEPESLRAIRCFGWLELGFREDYFFEMLRRAGLIVESRHLPEAALGRLYISRPA